MSDGDDQIKDMAWKFAGRMRIWGGGTNFSGELILYYSISLNTPKRFLEKGKNFVYLGLVHQFKAIKAFSGSYINFEIVKTSKGYIRGVFGEELKVIRLD